MPEYRDYYVFNEVESDSVSTDELSNQLHVDRSGPGYDSVQKAHDDGLPEQGGEIRVADGHTETDIYLSKPVKLVGAGAQLVDSGEEDTRTKIDFSGGNGIHVDGTGITLRDLQLVGDKSGTYGLKVGSTGVFDHSVTVDNVSVEKGYDNVVITGKRLGDRYDLISTDAARDGCHFDLQTGDYFNACMVDRLLTRGCGRDGLFIGNAAANSWNGNVVRQFESENNTRWGFYHDDGLLFRGNTIQGYGCEGNNGGGAGGEVHLMNTNGGDGNLWITQGDPNGVFDLNYSSDAFVIFSIANQPFYSSTYLQNAEAPTLKFPPQSSAPAINGNAVNLAVSDGTNWDPDADGTAELVMYDGTSWVEIQDLGTTY